MKHAEAVLQVMNRFLIVINGKLIINVSYAPAVECFYFDDNDEFIIIPYDNIGMADWDAEDGDNEEATAFYTFVDVHGTHHIAKFYRNDSLEIMRLIKNAL